MTFLQWSTIGQVMVVGCFSVLAVVDATSNTYSFETTMGVWAGEDIGSVWANYQPDVCSVTIELGKHHTKDLGLPATTKGFYDMNPSLVYVGLSGEKLALGFISKGGAFHSCAEGDVQTGNTSRRGPSYLEGDSAKGPWTQCMLANNGQDETLFYFVRNVAHVDGSILASGTPVVKPCRDRFAGSETSTEEDATSLSLQQGQLSV